MKEICENFLGIDPAEQMIAVRPAQHYTMGGVRTDATGQSPTLKGLFAAGEAACWDMHGFNRLGGNSVAETVVAGMIVGEFVADFCDKARNDTPVPMGLVQRLREGRAGALNHLMNGGGTEDASALKLAMQDIMTDKVGIFRTGEALASAVSELQALLERSRHIGLRSLAARRQPRAGDGLPHAEDAEAGAVRGLRRGRAHRKPRRALPRGPPAPRRRRLAQAHAGHLARQRDTLPTLNYEALDVKAMELPPGWRGYGAKDYLDHPDTPCARRRGGRHARADEGRARATRCRQALMPYQHLLPETLRGRNERVGRAAVNAFKTIPIVPAAAGLVSPARAAAPAATQRRLTLRVLRFNPMPARGGAALAGLRAGRRAGPVALHRARRDPREAGPLRCSSTSSAAPASAAAAPCWSTAARAWRARR